MSQYHITIQEGTRLPLVLKCTQCCPLYHCPLCSPVVFKPTHRYKLHKHLKCHLLRAISYQGYNIYKCNLGCRSEAHFHCFCKKLFLNRNQFTHHLNTKHRAPPATWPSVSSGPGEDGGQCSAGLTFPVNTPLSPSSADQPNAAPDLTCPPADAALSSSAASDETLWTSDSFSNAVADGLTVFAGASLAPAKTEPKNHAACPQCNTVMNKRGLSKHMQVKHSDRTADVTSSSHLRGPISPPTELPGGSEHRPYATPMELEILSQLRALQQQQSQILLLLQKLTDAAPAPDSDPADLEAMFPVMDEDGLAALELKLSENPHLKHSLVGIFGTTEGAPIDRTVQGILERILSNTFARRMTWKGENNKVSFADSSLKEIVNDSVRRNPLCARAADTAVESAVKTWLQQAGERDEGGRGGGGGERP